MYLRIPHTSALTVLLTRKRRLYKKMRNKYIAPDLEISLFSLKTDILALSNPENSTPEEGGDLPRDDMDDLFG